MRLANTVLDPEIITKSTQQLQANYDVVLLEGAGGLLVPITEQLLTLDYIVTQGYPVILVTSGRLGSINHTLLSLEAIRARGLTMHSVIYNHIHDTADNTDTEIANSSIDYLKNYLAQNYPNAHWLQLPCQDKDQKNNNDLILPLNFI